MQAIVQDVPMMPESDTPLKPIIDWYNIARERAKAPSYQIEAHFFGISLPRLRNIIDVNQFDDAQIELLDKHEFDQAIHICKKVISFDYKDMMGPAYYNLGQCVTKKAIQLLRKDRDSVNAIKLLDESVKYMEKSSALGFELAIKALKRNK